jgi:hypothetical protein
MGAEMRPPAALSVIFRCLDPADDGTSIVIAHDLLDPDFPQTGFKEASAYLAQLLADPEIPNADLKGLLNRETSCAWSLEFGFGADAKAARRYLEALQQAIARELA